VAVLAAIVFITWFFLRAKSQLKRRWVTGSNNDWEEIPSSRVNAMLPALLSMMVYQMMQNQEQHQQQTEQFWMMNGPTHDMDVSTFSDNSTWDF
jgi:hypothetical protein